MVERLPCVQVLKRVGSRGLRGGVMAWWLQETESTAASAAAMASDRTRPLYVHHSTTPRIAVEMLTDGVNKTTLLGYWPSKELSRNCSTQPDPRKQTTRLLSSLPFLCECVRLVVAMDETFINNLVHQGAESWMEAF
jgi:hypothetical protein